MDTNALLAVGTLSPIITALTEMIPDISYVYEVQSLLPQHAESASVTLMWEPSSRMFVPMHPHVITEDLFVKAALTRAKLDALNKMTLAINMERGKLATPVTYGQFVYRAKQEQAKAFRERNYDAARLQEYTYVAQYASFANISPRQAADDILFKAQLDDEVLLRTELTRLTFFDRLRRANDLQAVGVVMKDFARRA